MNQVYNHFRRVLMALLLLAVTAVCSIAQDRIIRKDGKTIQATAVNEKDKTYIRYKRYENPTGPDYFIYKSEVDRIDYEKSAQEVQEQPVKTAVKEPQKTPETAPIRIASETQTAPESKPISQAQKGAAASRIEKPVTPALVEARFRKKGMLYSLLGGGAFLAGVGTFVSLQGSYKSYKTKLETSNEAFTNWYRTNYNKLPDASELSQPKSFLNYGATGVYAAFAAILGGAALEVIALKNFKQARMLQNRQLSIAPTLSPENRLAGVKLRLSF